MCIRDRDDALLEKYFAGETLTIEEIKSCIRKATLANAMVPVTCGTSYKNKGVQKLLDAIIDYMPAPTDVPAIKGINPETEEMCIRDRTLGLRWLTTYSRARSERTMRERLAGEILDAINGNGGAAKKRDDTHKMAEANRAFAHYRW